MLEQARILVVDDEPSIRLLLAEELAQEGYQVRSAGGGEEALAMLQERSFDLILLDLKMPRIDGLQVMREARRLAPDTVVIMLTAYATLDSAIQAVRHGAHDYLLKPSTTEQILASVNEGLAKRRQRLRQQELIRRIEDTAHQLRSEEMKATAGGRAAPPGPHALQVRELILDRDGLTVSLQGRQVNLTPTEFKLLLCLMENADRITSYRRLAEAVHGLRSDQIVARDAISTHMWRLRRKLQAAAAEETYIVNVRGQGYKVTTE